MIKVARAIIGRMAYFMGLRVRGQQVSYLYIIYVYHTFRQYRERERERRYESKI